jgi:uncharacterized Zn finger protein
MEKQWQCPSCLTVGFYDKTTRTNGKKSMTIYKCNKCGTVKEELQKMNEKVIGEIIKQDGTLID